MRQNILVGFILLGALVGPHLLACDEEPAAAPEPSTEPPQVVTVLSDFRQCMVDAEATLLFCSHGATSVKEIQECATAYDTASVHRCLPMSPREKIVRKRQAEILARAEMDDWMFDDEVRAEIIVCPEDDIGPNPSEEQLKNFDGALCVRNTVTGDVY